MRAGMDGDTSMLMRLVAAGVVAFALVWGLDRLSARVGWLPVGIGLALLAGTLLLRTLQSRRSQRRFLAHLRGAILDAQPAPASAPESAPALVAENDG